MKSRILLLTTGGTIASLPTDDGLAPGLDGEDLAELRAFLDEAMGKGGGT